MAKRVEEVTLGIDVSKQQLEVYGGNGASVRVIANEAGAIEAFLSGFTAPVVMAVEATNVFHEALVEIAFRHGCTVYVVDGYRLNKYREAVGIRAKTDACDAELIHRYLLAERVHLRVWRGQDGREKQLWRLLKRRAKLVKLRTQLTMSLQDLALSVPEVRDARLGLNRLIKRVTALAQQQAKALGWHAALVRLQSIPGVGPLSALALQTMFQRGVFSTVDRFIAFLGLDVRVRDSGSYKGRRKLTKQGDPEVRRLLFNGARAAAYRHPDWAEHKQRLMAKGFSEIQASVILARKIARIGYALLKTGSAYNPAHKTCQSS